MCVLTAAISRAPQSVYPEIHMYMPAAAIGRPTLGLGVQPSIVVFYIAHIYAHSSSNWSANLQIIS